MDAAAVARSGIQGLSPIVKILNPGQNQFHDESLREIHVDRDPDSINNNEVSMATSASFGPGVTLADKLRVAASKGLLDKVQELVAAGATFEADREGRTAVHYAALNGYADCVTELASNGCPVDTQDNMGYTSLHRAAAQGHLEVVRVLMARGCSLDRQDDVHGNSALHEAAWNGYSRTLEALVQNGAYVNIVNKAGFSALHLAAQNGHNQSARVLLYGGCNPDYKNNYGDTPLHTAARYGHAGVTRILISARCNISQQNKNGDSALHISAALKRRKIAKLLMENSIDCSIRNKQNETAADVAKRKEHREIAAILTATKATGAGKASKKERKNRQSRDNLVEDERRDKKGFFFKKKSKSKEREVIPVTMATGSVSESSSIQAGFAPEPRPVIPELATNHSNERGVSAAASKSRDHRPVHGILGKYVEHKGTSLYRDLAGNIRQGPMGYKACECAPEVQRLRERMDNDRTTVMDRIEFTKKQLNNRIDHVDSRTAQQVYAIDKLTKERLDAERKHWEDVIASRMTAQRRDVDKHLQGRHMHLRGELHNYVDERVANMDDRWHYHDDSCQVGQHEHQQEQLPPPGKLVRSRSDETLSVSSSHPSRRHHHRLRVRNMRDLATERASRMERKMRKSREKRAASAGGNGAPQQTAARPHTLHEDMPELQGCLQQHPLQQHDAPLSHRERVKSDPNILGDDKKHDYENYDVIEMNCKKQSVMDLSPIAAEQGWVKVTPQKSWATRSQPPPSCDVTNDRQQPQYVAEQQRPLPSDMYVSNAVFPAAPPTTSPSQESYESSSPEHPTTRDSASNPDSGYSSKIYNLLSNQAATKGGDHNNSATTNGSTENSFSGGNQAKLDDSTPRRYNEEPARHHEVQQQQQQQQHQQQQQQSNWYRPTIGATAFASSQQQDPRMQNGDLAAPERRQQPPFAAHSATARYLPTAQKRMQEPPRSFQQHPETRSYPQMPQQAPTANYRQYTNYPCRASYPEQRVMKPIHEPAARKDMPPPPSAQNFQPPSHPVLQDAPVRREIRRSLEPRLFHQDRPRLSEPIRAFPTTRQYKDHVDNARVPLGVHPAFQSQFSQDGHLPRATDV